ncbi:hypothetical protein E2542_SST10191 [Spatholobus suberectus]|nr:hypothetical protein E2542_SST10191 [Spatholobus suberectus]
MVQNYHMSIILANIYVTHNQGVTAVALDGDDNDRVVVTGDNVDTVCLANMLKKKFCSFMYNFLSQF